MIKRLNFMRMVKSTKGVLVPESWQINIVSFKSPTTTNQKQMLLKQCPEQARILGVKSCCGSVLS